MSDLLPMALPVAKPRAPTAKPLVCGVCGDPNWIACAPGTASTAELYPASNIVAFRADDGVASKAWCRTCWLAAFPCLSDGVRLSDGEAEFASWGVE